MTVDEIKSAVLNGRIVHWINKNYRVIVDSLEQFYIVCELNDSAIGLTWRDGKTLNGKPEDFFTE